MESGKYEGWGFYGRPYTKTEYNNSYLYKNTQKSYNQYLKDYQYLKKGELKKVSLMLKKSKSPIKNTEPKTPK